MEVKRFLLLNVTLLVAVVAAMFFGMEWYPAEMVKCLSDHSSVKIPAGLKDTRTKAILTFQLYMVISTIWNHLLRPKNNNATTEDEKKEEKKKGNREFAPSWSMVIMWYQTWYYAIAYLRELEGEYTCSLSKSKAYGISGHSYYYMYTSVLVLTSSIRKDDGESKLIGRLVRYVLWALKIAHPVLSAIVVYDTIVLGFHTLKQVFSGMYFSCVALLLLGTVESSDGRSVVRPIAHSAIGYTCHTLLANLGVYPVKSTDINMYILAVVLQFVESCWAYFKSTKSNKVKKD